MLRTLEGRFSTPGRTARHRVGCSKAWRKPFWAMVIALSVPLTATSVQVTIAADKAADKESAERDQKVMDSEQKKLKVKVGQFLRRRRGEICVIALLETQWHEVVTRKYRTVEPNGVAVTTVEIESRGLHPVPTLDVRIVKDDKTATEMIVDFMAPVIKTPSSQDELKRHKRKKSNLAIPTRQWAIVGRFATEDDAEEAKTVYLQKFDQEPRWKTQGNQRTEQWYPNRRALEENPP